MSTLGKFTELQQWTHWAAQTWIAECEAYGFQFFPTEVYRAQERQNRIFVQGRNPEIMARELAQGKYNRATYQRGLQLLKEIGPIRGNIVSWTLSSMHTQRLAADIVPVNCSYEQIEAVANRFGIYRPTELVKLGDLGHFQFEKAHLAPVTIDPIARLNGLVRRLQITVNPYLKVELPKLIERLKKRLGV